MDRWIIRGDLQSCLLLQHASLCSVQASQEATGSLKEEENPIKGPLASRKLTFILCIDNFYAGDYVSLVNYWLHLQFIPQIPFWHMTSWCKLDPFRVLVVIMVMQSHGILLTLRQLLSLILPSATSFPKAYKTLPTMLINVLTFALQRNCKKVFGKREQKAYSI